MAIMLERPQAQAQTQATTSPSSLGDRLALVGGRPAQPRILPVPSEVAEPVTAVLDLVSTDAALVRRALLRALSTGTSRLATVGTGSRRRHMAQAEMRLWVEEMVHVADWLDGDRGRAAACAAHGVGRLPFYVVVTPDAVVLRRRREVMSEDEAEQLLLALVQAATTGASRSR